MNSRRSLALAAAASLLAATGPAAAECAAIFKAGTKFHIVEKKVGSDRPLTITVAKNENGYVKLDVYDSKMKKTIHMPGSVKGDTAMFAGAERTAVWVCTCDPKGASCEDTGATAADTAQLRINVAK